MVDKRTVLITGCSEGGIGAALVHEYQRQGYYVFATARNTKKIPQSLAKSTSNVSIVELDVTSQESVDRAVKQVSQITDKLDVLVNNSGVAITSTVLDTDIEHARGMFEVNVMGVLAVTKAFAPLLVRGRDPCVVNNSSVAGETQLPFSGVYGASKAATTIMSESLRLELIPLKIRVVTVITGIIDSNLHSNEPKKQLPPSSFYTPVEGWLADRESGKNRPPGMPAQKYAKQFVRRCEGGATGKVYIGPLTPFFVYLKWWMPTFIWDMFMMQAGPPGFLKNKEIAAKRG